MSGDGKRDCSVFTLCRSQLDHDSINADFYPLKKVNNYRAGARLLANIIIMTAGHHWAGSGA